MRRKFGQWKQLAGWYVARVRLKLFLLFGSGVLLLCWPPLLSGQFIGYVTSQSTVQKLFTLQQGNATSRTITNLGQSAHYITVCNVGFSGTVLLEASTDGTFNPPITIAAANYALGGVGSDSNCHLITAGGYYPTMRIRTANVIGTGTTSVLYSGIGGPVAPGSVGLSSIGPVSPISCDLHLSTTVAQSASVQLVPGVAGQTIIVCSMTLSFDAATTAGNIKTGGGAPGTCSNAAIVGRDYFLFVTASTPQTLHIVSGSDAGLFRILAGQDLCIALGTITANTSIDVSYAQITF